MTPKFCLLVCFSFFRLCIDTFAQDDPTDSKRRKLVDTLTYETQSGLPIAASKIYFTDAKFTFSGFGETNYVNYSGSKNRGSSDLELYYTNLQRFVAYAAWKPVNWLVVYGEFFAEFLNDGSMENDFEYLPEFFLDFLLDERFNIRVGTHQPGIGFINNNDEPIMFYSVNRPEAERLIIPSQWIDLGVTFYGTLKENLKWSMGVFQGLDLENLNGATWIRRGRDNALRFNFGSFVFNPKLVYHGMEDTEFSVSGLFTTMGKDKRVAMGEGLVGVDAQTRLFSTYVRHKRGNWNFMFLGTYGQMKNTDRIYRFLDNTQVMGQQVYGGYVETSYNILPLLATSKKEGDTKKTNGLFRKHEFQLPVFVRLELLNTHADIHPLLQDVPMNQTDLTSLTLGANFNPRRNMVIKSNYQFRWNAHALPDGSSEGNRIEMGIGFIF
ncbi:hypothetical protein ADIS_3057 [Lunatimonas lonarensis]|uniref:Phosphate-selective porin O and P n=1 Tax=Lunatimonas lonarensis TaxID=1232681 RepID=R7ZRB6_9BACT|nr:hypothetical protein [Lunatimonas lonarensis]EON76607.1 hypothetical protein ADIS_3057 [Lunatimonas lonarensis]